MTEQSWQPLFRASASTVTKVLRSPAFLHARARAATVIESAGELRALADSVDTLDHENAPLSAIADRVAAAVRFLRATAEALEGRPTTTSLPGASHAARGRLLVASLIYLVTPVDLVPDFRAGGYIDDVLLLAWVFGAAAQELEPYLAERPDAGLDDSDG
jgi:uncharacterized membrane protein YkvA (DUF1232 family)